MTEVNAKTNTIQRTERTATTASLVHCDVKLRRFAVQIAPVTTVSKAIAAVVLATVSPSSQSSVASMDGHFGREKLLAEDIAGWEGCLCGFEIKAHKFVSL